MKWNEKFNPILGVLIHDYFVRLTTEWKRFLLTRNVLKRNCMTWFTMKLNIFVLQGVPKWFICEVTKSATVSFERIFRRLSVPAFSFWVLLEEWDCAGNRSTVVGHCTYLTMLRGTFPNLCFCVARSSFTGWSPTHGSLVSRVWDSYF